MNIKLAQKIIFLVAFSFIIGSNARAMFMAPPSYTPVTIDVTSIGGDAHFDFHVVPTAVDDPWDFYIETHHGNDAEIEHFFDSDGSLFNLTASLPTGWQQTSAVCVNDSSKVLSSPTDNGIILNLATSAGVTCTFTNIKQANLKTPVLIIPGVLGTDIIKGTDKLWLNLSQMATDIGDEFMDPLEFDQNLNPIDTSLNSGDIVLSPLIRQHFYDLLVQEFKNQGYTEGTSSDATLFTFPYDWRYGVSGVVDAASGKTTVDLLKEKIDAILAQTGASKVDVVAHSTGGLLVKKYVMDHQSDSHIGKAVFVGVPNLGAPMAIKVLLEGSNFGVPWLADSEMQKIGQNFPVVYDLAPSAKYYSEKWGRLKFSAANILTTKRN